MMKSTSLVALALMIWLGLPASPAQAQLSRTFVSAATGNDANNCDQPTPCRSFQGAHNKTNPDGEITVLDAGGYGSVTITKSISIVNEGSGEASVLVSGGATGITISGGAAAYVNLRGITVQGIGFGGGTGLRFNSGFSLTITNCVFRNNTGDGIDFTPNVSGTSNLSIFNTLSADNGGSGIDVTPAGQVTLRIALDGVQLVNNSVDGMIIDGFQASGSVNASVMNTVSANNGRDGITVFATTNNAQVNLMLMQCIISNNIGTALDAEGGGPGILRVGQSIISANGRTLLVGSGNTLQSFGDNYIAGNADGDPSPPLIARK